MARLDDLIAEVRDTVLREKLADALADLKRRQTFGLVFEEHVPESSALVRLPIQVGATVQKRSDLDSKNLYTVASISSRSKATVLPEDGGDATTVSAKDLIVVKRFGDPIFPSLTSIGAVRRGPLDRPHHALVNGENFHALQLFVYLYEGQADCIYIDPPYNTGARDWKYNNRYVDKKDTWRHSKWLSMMEKRLWLAKRLLKPDGVLICTIDEHEVNHLGMLLEKVFKTHLHYMITIVINPKGREKANFAPVDEFAFFVVPDLGKDVVVRAPRMPTAEPNLFENTEMPDPLADVLGAEEAAAIEDDPDAEIVEVDELEIEEQDDQWEIRHARRRGGGAESSSYRDRRWGQFYPIYINEEERKVVFAGEAIPLGREPSFRRKGGLRPIWPIDTEGRHRVWGFIPTSMQKLIDAGHVLLGRYHKDRDDWTINYRVPKKNSRKLKTVWWEKAHDAGTHGTELLKKLLGQPGLFPFPKSVYAVRDCLAAVVRDRPNALIIDFFAGSGTTYHATCLLNAEDGGSRRSICVTNNEVQEKLAKRLNKQGICIGDPKFEQHGIFEQATRPRCEAVTTGKRPDGKNVPGVHIDGRPLAMGFAENIEFFRIDYLDPDDVDLGNQFEAILPSLWLAAGGIGSRQRVQAGADLYAPSDSNFAVLFRDRAFRKLRQLLSERPAITHVWIVTDSEDAFAQMRSLLPVQIKSSMLYRDYLRNFRINTRGN